MDIEFRNLPPVHVAYMRHTGPYGHPGISDAWQKFACWCESRGCLQPRRDMYGVSLDNPFVTPASQLRYDVCVAVPSGFEINQHSDADVSTRVLDGGRYACARFIGTGLDVGASFVDLYNTWLPSMQEVPDDTRHCFEWYDLTYAMDATSGTFHCWLCVPVR